MNDEDELNRLETEAQYLKEHGVDQKQALAQLADGINQRYPNDALAKGSNKAENIYMSPPKAGDRICPCM